MGEFSMAHWLVVLVILLIFFGPSRLPQLGQSLGKALRGFKEGLTEKEKEAPPTVTDANSRIESVKTEKDVTHETETTRKNT